MKRKLSSSMEDYLEAIIVLKERDGVARVKNISKFLNIKASSVTSALNILSKEGFVVHERYGYVELTPSGKAIAERVLKRHNMFVTFLTEVLNIDAKIASEDACKMEHAISPQTFRKLNKFIQFVETCPDHDRPDWLKSFDHFFKTGKRLECKVRKMKQKAVSARN